jgi:putative hydrolase of the HAD superfamily
VFIKALEKASTNPNDSVMIGDSFEADILGAKNIGMETIFFNYRNEKIPNGYKLINALSEIKSYL